MDCEYCVSDESHAFATILAEEGNAVLGATMLRKYGLSGCLIHEFSTDCVAISLPPRPIRTTFSFHQSIQRASAVMEWSLYPCRRLKSLLRSDR
jgi:hypothetical protein